MKRSLIIAALFISVAGLIYIYLTYSENKDIRDLQNKSMQIVRKVEEYKQKNHKIPDNMENLNLNLPDNYPINYNVQQDGVNYYVSFQIAAFKSMAYDSSTKSWRYQ